MKFIELSDYLSKLDKTSSRIEITKILADLFKKSEVNEIEKISYLLLGQLAPSYKSIIFSMADKMVVRAIAKASGKSIEDVTKIYKDKGDLGESVESLSLGKSEGLKVDQVFDYLVEIAKHSGEASQEAKVEGLSKLLKELDPLSSKYVVRILLGKLRLGFSDKTMIDALSWSEKGDKSGSKEINEAFNIMPDIGKLAKLVKEKGVLGISQKIIPEVGVPVVPMLAQRLNSPAEMVKKMGTVAVEPKFDGLRIFIHYRAKDYPKKGNPQVINIFTRNMNLIDTAVLPEILDLPKYLKAKEVILDSEAVGVNLEQEKILDFQKTMQRRRKHEVEATAKDIPLQFQVFDILLSDGKSLLNVSYAQRRKELESVIPNKNPLLRVDEQTVTDDPNVIDDLYKKYIKMGLEGIVVKKENGFYVSGRTGWNWVKMKQEADASGKLADTVDAVVMGYTVGKGKRISFGVGQFLVGVKDGDSFKTTTKIGTGLTDDQFREMKRRLTKLQVKEIPKEYVVHKNYTPDFWVTPSLVVEIAADEITKSPTHSSGLALRFPRLIRFRDDKRPQDATTVKELEKLFKLQRK